jgi:hypothetical protein
MSRIAAWVLAGLAACAAVSAKAEQLTVHAHERKWNGQVWDGAEVYGPLALPTNTPPDLAVCLVGQEGLPQCTERVDGRQRKSECQNSHSCTFRVRMDAKEPVGILIYDIDLRHDDLVDIVIIVPDERTPPDRYRGIEARLRELMDTRSRVFTPMERDRRARQTQVVTRAQCATGCNLVQSRITLAP